MKTKVLCAGAFFVIFLASSVSAQFLYGLEKEIFVCEGEDLNYLFNVGKQLDANDTYEISPLKIFFLRKAGDSELEIFSKNLTKEDVRKIHERKVLFYDGKIVDEKEINIHVLETNNAPIVDDIGVKTIEVSKNQSLLLDLSARDVEDENLEMSLIFSSGKRFFDVANGTIEATPTRQDLGNYEVKVCATDKGIENSDSAEICGESSVASKTGCGLFYLSVTELNKKPIIASYFPTEKEINAADANIVFAVNFSDENSEKLQINWYIDNKKVRTEYKSERSLFEKTFNCESAGAHVVRAEIFDGIASENVVWDVRVREGFCAENFCESKLACGQWDLCRNTEQSYKIGTLAREDYLEIKEKCSLSGWNEEQCGFQIRDCEDLNYCRKDISGETFQVCYFTLNPSCSDGIKNCHDGDCEFLVDCGGPCGACATCSDGIQNQGEENVDCGGNCKECKKRSGRVSGKEAIFYVSILAGIFLIFFAIKKFAKVYREESELTKIEKRRKKNEI